MKKAAPLMIFFGASVYFLVQDYLTQGDGAGAIIDKLKLIGQTKMKVSNAGRVKITLREGVRYNSYADVAGKRTIGVGHLITPLEKFVEPITSQQVDDLLSNDLIYAENAINANVKMPLAQNEFDALASFIFNIGTGAFRKSSVLTALNAGDKLTAANNMLKFNIYHDAAGVAHVSSGLSNRRSDEVKSFKGS
jgi:lysozyme